MAQDPGGMTCLKKFRTRRRSQKMMASHLVEWDLEEVLTTVHQVEVSQLSSAIWIVWQGLEIFSNFSLRLALLLTCGSMVLELVMLSSFIQKMQLKLCGDIIDIRGRVA